jgi:phosphoglycolate phosphatase
MIRLVVFDLDGTLVDSRRDLADAANRTLAAFGAPALAEESVGRMVGDGVAALVERAFRAAGREAPPDALDRFLAFYQTRLLEHTRPYAGVPEVLAALAPRVGLAVLTNKPLAATRAILEGLQLARFFAPDRVLGGDGPFARKPDPSGLRHLMQAAGASSDATLLVGDSLVDWRTARAAPAQMCLARYGFGWESLAPDTLDDGLACAIDRPEELLQHV